MNKGFKYQIGLFIAIMLTGIVFSQEGNNVWKGNKAYNSRDYEKAQSSYQKSMDLEPSQTASYNLANSLYKQKKYAEAGKMYNAIAEKSEDKSQKAEAYHNLGNSYLKDKKIDESIEAYKKALRNNPGDEDSRYNLSYAMKLKKEEEKKEDQEQDQDKDKDEEQKDKEKEKDQEKKDQDKEEKEKDQEQKDQDQDQEKQEQQQEQSQDQISKEDAERLLKNLENEEKKTQEKMNLQKRKSSGKQIENDW